MSQEIEKLVNCRQAAEILGVGRTYMSALKKAMREAGQPIGSKFFVSKVRQFIIDHPEFNSDHQKSDRAWMREALEVLKSPRHGQRQVVIAGLEKMLQG